MGETGREVRVVDGERTTFCTRHELPLRWILMETGRSKFTCPDCEAFLPSRGQDALQFPLIRFSQTWHRDRPLTDKEKQHRPLKHGGVR